jgi:molybdate transport repressor ModE-like protein
MLVMLDVRRLMVLRAVAREGSLSAAARQLGYTQPAVTHHLRRLEREAGTAVITRAGRGVRLTEAGQALVAHADALAARLALAEEEVAALAGLRGGTARLAAFPSANATLVPTALALLRGRHPGITVSLIEAEPPEALALLRQGDCDLALSFSYRPYRTSGTGAAGGGGTRGAGYVAAGHGAAHDGDGPQEGGAAGLERVPLLSDRLHAVLPRGHRLAGAPAVRLAQLAGETWIAGCERCRGNLLLACAAAGFAPAIALATDDYIAVQRLVGAGLGVALLPGLVATTLTLPEVAVLPLDPPPCRDVAALLPAGSRPPAVAALLAALQDAAADQPAGPPGAPV